MGCHTWFYRKIERTQEEAKENCLRGLRKYEELNISILKDRNYSDESFMHSDAVLKRKIRMVENNLCQRAVWNHQDDEDMTEYIDGKGLYIEDTGYHDVFRKCGYPNTKLFSLEETLEYINNPENNCTIFDWTMDDLKDFWSKYPDAFIDFG